MHFLKNKTYLPPSDFSKTELKIIEGIVFLYLCLILRWPYKRCPNPNGLPSTKYNLTWPKPKVKHNIKNIYYKIRGWGRFLCPTMHFERNCQAKLSFDEQSLSRYKKVKLVSMCLQNIPGSY